jgi:ribosomal protein S19
MRRAKWKGPYFDQKTFKIVQTSIKKKTMNLDTASRSSEITPKFIGKTVNIHNGRSYSEISVTKDMIGHKFGEFSFTRGKFSFKKKKSKK